MLDAAAECIRRFGVDKTTLGEVATLAKVSRQTAYRLFPGGRNELFEAAIGRAAIAVGERASTHGARFDDPLEIVVEVVLFSLRETPKDPVLSRSLVSSSANSFPGTTTSQSMTFEPNRIGLSAYREKIPGLPAKAYDELIELVARIAVSVLLLNEGEEFTRDGRRARKKLRAWLGPIVREHITRYAADSVS